MKQKNSTIRHNHQSGFTLVEMAVVLIIFGLIMSTVMVGMRLYMSDLLMSKTLESVEETETALLLFQIDQGKYPCPADPTLTPADPNYGVADCGAAGVITAIGRDIDNADGDNDATTGGDLQVLIGAVPHNTILDPDNDIDTRPPYEDYRANHSMDGWGNKLTYAVTRILTDAVPNEFDHEMGGIFVVDENNTSILDKPGIAHVVIISHGQNGKGGFTEQGRKIDDCVDLIIGAGGNLEPPADYATKTPIDERENCDHEFSGTAEAIFLKGVRNDVKADYNDDVVKFMASSVSNLWAYTNAIYHDNGTPGDPSDDFLINQIANTNGGNIGIGVDEPKAQLHLEGDVQAFEMHVEGLCDPSGNDCLPPEYIGGEVPDMRCPTGYVVTKIGRPTAADKKPKVVCEDPFAATAWTPCPAGTFMTGISNVSGPTCVTPP